MRPRTIAIGDIHGCSLALEALLAAIEPRPDDVIVTLGDYVNRGPDSRGVLDRLIELEGQCTPGPDPGQPRSDVPRRPGAANDAALSDLLDMGGGPTLRPTVPGGSPRPTWSRIPPEHLAFLGRCRDFYETETHIFVHAQYDPDLAMDEQSSLWLRWESLRDGIPGPHVSGKRAIVGHSSQKSGEILDLGHLVCIDTFCYGGGWLTALDVHTG